MLSLTCINILSLHIFIQVNDLIARHLKIEIDYSDLNYTYAPYSSKLKHHTTRLVSFCVGGVWGVCVGGCGGVWGCVCVCVCVCVFDCLFVCLFVCLFAFILILFQSFYFLAFTCPELVWERCKISITTKKNWGWRKKVRTPNRDISVF